MGIELVARTDLGLEGGAGVVFAVSEDDLGLGTCQVAEPVQQLRLSGVPGKAAQGVDFGLNGDGFAEDFDLFRAVDDAFAESASGLVADKHEVNIGAPEIMAKVMEDTAALTHAG